MIHAIPLWLLVVGFLGAGTFNMIGTQSTQTDFVRWGYPSWWCRVTGILEILIAVIIALPPSRSVGLGMGGAVIAAAAITVVRHREYANLIPAGIFLTMMMLALVWS
jgi:hypothetical protein